MQTEILVKTKEGNEINILLKVVTLSQYYFMAFGSDITVQKKAENEKEKLKQQLYQSQKMESLGRLAGGIAHDFNNLLTAIRGYSDLVYDSLNEGDPMRNDIIEIQKASDHAASLTQQLLTFSRKQIISPKVLDINKVVSEADKMLRRIIGEDIDFVFIPGKNINKVMIDPGQINQILVNLAVNSRDAMPDGGKLTIETRNIYLEENKCQSCNDPIVGEHLMIAVSDNGPGMTTETIKKIFEPFFTTKQCGQGTGLGLAIVHGIVHQNNGHINVYSELGSGSIFKIYLPVSSKDVDIDTLQDIPVSLHGNETILLVEDQELVRQLAVRTLRSHGYKIMEAKHGEDALTLIESKHEKIDLLLTDVVMPLMNGKELYFLLSKRITNLKVLYMSGYTENAIAHHGVLDKGTNFIHKPFRPKELVKKVRQVLDLKES